MNVACSVQGLSILARLAFGSDHSWVCVCVQGEAVLGIIECSVAPLIPTYQMPGAPLTRDSPVFPDIPKSPGGQSCS